MGRTNNKIPYTPRVFYTKNARESGITYRNGTAMHLQPRDAINIQNQSEDPDYRRMKPGKSYEPNLIKISYDHPIAFNKRKQQTSS